MAGLVVVLGAVVAYVVLLFLIHNFTYRTWVFDLVVVAGAAGAVIGWLGGGNAVVTVLAVAGAGLWFVLTRRELRIRGSHRLNLRPGDRFPPLRVVTTDGVAVTEQDLVRDAPTLLVLYRGWWCPSHKPQLDELVAAHEQLEAAGLAVYAGSVDGPEEAQPVQDRVGDKITILCSVPLEFLDQVGVRDPRGAPWYDRLIFGAENGEIAMPAAIVIDDAGTVVFAHRSTRIDDRAPPDQILTSI